jgi:hypothetical protein
MGHETATSATSAAAAATAAGCADGSDSATCQPRVPDSAEHVIEPRRLFSLHVSALKVASFCVASSNGGGSSSSSGSATDVQTPAWSALMVSRDMLVGSAYLAGAFGGDGAAKRELVWPWLHLSGRALCALADALHALAEPAAPAVVSARAQLHPRELQDLSDLLSEVNAVAMRMVQSLPFAAVPGEQGSWTREPPTNPAATFTLQVGPALGCVLELHNAARSALFAMLTAVSCEAQRSTALTGSSAAPWQVLQDVPLLETKLDQIRQFGVAMIANLPVPGCCNSPGCVELGGASEAGLVGGSRGALQQLQGGLVLQHQVPAGTLGAAQASVQAAQGSCSSALTHTRHLQLVGRCIVWHTVHHIILTQALSPEPFILCLAAAAVLAYSFFRSLSYFRFSYAACRTSGSLMPHVVLQVLLCRMSYFRFSYAACRTSGSLMPHAASCGLQCC